MRNLNGTLSAMLLIAATSVSHAATPTLEELTTTRIESEKRVMWEQVSPGNSGYTNLVRYHPTKAGCLMICPDMWNSYQTLNNGETWHAFNDYDGDMSFFHIRDLYYSEAEPDMALAACSSELWITKNMGKNWDVVRNCPWYQPKANGREGRGGKKIATLAIDPKNPDVWFVAGGSFVRGQEWLSCYEEMTLKYPHGYESQYSGRMWRTLDGGKSWSEVSTGLDPKAQVGRVIINPNNTKQIFAASNYGVFRSDDGGTTWQPNSAGQLDNNIIMDMDSYYNVETGRFILYVIDQTQFHPSGRTTKCTGGIFKSDDCGETWVKINGDLALDLNRISGGVADNYYQYIAKWFNDKELRSMPKNPGSEDVAAMKAKYPQLPTAALQTFWMISADPSCEDRVYIGLADPQTYNSIQPGRLWVTHNGGEKWINTARLYEDTWGADRDYWEERGNPWNENMKVGHQSPHMRHGVNYPLRSMRGFDVGVDGSVMMVSDHSTMLSKDHGETWQQMDEDYTPTGGIIGHGNSNLGFLTIVQDRRTDKTFIGSSEHYIWFPEKERYNGKMAIRRIESTPPTVDCFVFDPYNINNVYASSGRQEEKQYLYKSEDLGENWGRYGIATPATNAWMDDFFTNSLLIDPINPQYMYHGVTTIENRNRLTEGGFFRSEDGGKSFQQHNNGLLEISRVKSIVFDPRDQSCASLFISAEIYKSGWRGPRTTKGGLFFSSNRGDSWQRVELPAEIEGVQYIKFDNTNRLYITTGHVGGGGDGVWYSDDFGKEWHQIFVGAEAEHIDISPFDNNMIAISMCTGAKNPGFYFSRDRGVTWSKNNTNVVTPHWIMDIHFDIFQPNKIWLATNATGLYRGTIADDGEVIKVLDIKQEAIEIHDGKSVALNYMVVDNDFTGVPVDWRSENEAIATVGNDGVVTPVGRGCVKIWVSTPDGRYTDFAVVTVF